VFVAERAKDVGLGRKKEEEKPADEMKPEGATFGFKDDDDDDEGDGKPYEVTSVDLAPRCPSCANELQSEEDVICLHCGFNLRTREAAKTRKVKDVTGGDVFMHLLPGIAAAVLFFILFGIMVTFIILRAMLFAATWNPEFAQGDNATFTLNCCSCCTIWTVLACGYFMYLSGRFTIKRLIYEPKPPEVEL
jgi:hypothetical protein